MARQRRQLWRYWALLPLLVLAGCQNLLGRSGLPKDPLFLHHPPVLGRMASTSPAAVTVVDPTPPGVPLEIASRPSYARLKSFASPDRVVLTGQRAEKNASQDAKTPVRISDVP